MSDIAYGLMLSAFAGLSTTLGSLLGLFWRNPGEQMMTFTLGFSGGVMLHVSYAELLQNSIVEIGFGTAHVAFFAGILIMFLIDTLLPHDYGAERRAPGERNGQGRLLQTGLFVAVGLGIHNFPEGMAAFVGALEDRSLGVAIAAAIAIHNIPEGLAVSAPVFAATGSRSKAFWWSFLSGISEPIGALVAALVLLPLLNGAVLGYVLATVAGVMVFIALDELVPISRCMGHEHLSILGVVSGMAIMALSLWMLA